MIQDTAIPPDTKTQRRVISIAFALNLLMFIVGLIAGYIGQSSGLIADSLDMLADACGYVIVFAAIERSTAFKARSALISGSMLFVLGGGVLVDVIRRILVGSEPMGIMMIGAALLSLAVNGTVLRMLRQYRSAEIHLRAAYLDTKVDVIANLSVLVAGIAVFVTGFRYADLAVGAVIGLYVVREAWELIEEARNEHQKSTSQS